jgi:hypothetical protein
VQDDGAWVQPCTIDKNEETCGRKVNMQRVGEGGERAACTHKGERKSMQREPN